MPVCYLGGGHMLCTSVRDQKGKGACRRLITHNIILEIKLTLWHILWQASGQKGLKTDETLLASS